MKLHNPFSSLFKKTFNYPGPSESAIITSYLETLGVGIDAEVPLRNIVDYRKTDVKFRLSVLMYTAYSVGSGFHNTADTSTPTGKMCLEMIDNFCDEWNLDELNQLIAMDVWPTGNCFIEPLGNKNKPLLGCQMLPLSSFTKIRRDEHGDVIQFLQEWGGHYKYLEPSAVYHFKWLPEDASGWGSGLGQPMAREGVGYKSTSGRVIRRPSWFAISEAMDDISMKMTYAGLPRYDVYAKVPDEKVTEVSQNYNKMDPLQHAIRNFEGKTETISLDTQNKFDSFIRKIDDQIIAGNMTPIPRLWSSLNFTYASAEAAIEATLPLIRMYQRAHKRFIENFIYKPFIMQEKNEAAVKKADVRLNWGLQDPLEIDDIVKVWNILKDPIFQDSFDPKDILNMLAEAGVNITPLEKPVTEISDQIRDIHKLQNQKEKKIPLSLLTKDDQIKELRYMTMKRLIKKFG